MMLTKLIENVQCPSKLFNYVEKCYQSWRPCGPQYCQKKKSHFPYRHHHHRIRKKLCGSSYSTATSTSTSPNTIIERHCDKMTKGDTNSGIANGHCRTTATSSTSTTKTTSPRTSTMAAAAMSRTMPSSSLHSSSVVVAFTTMFFIVTMHCQIANADTDITNKVLANSEMASKMLLANTTSTIIVDIDDDVEYVRRSIGDGHNDDDADIYSHRNLHSRTRLKRSPIFQNEFAVYVPNGGVMADSIAGKYGFSNMGQVSLDELQHEFYYYYRCDYMPYLDIYNHPLAGRRLRMVESNISILFIWLVLEFCMCMRYPLSLQSPHLHGLQSKLQALHNVRCLVRCKP